MPDYPISEQALEDWQEFGGAVVERDRDCVVIQRDELRERLDRIRAAAESDPDVLPAFKDFLLRETEPGWLHVTKEMVNRLRATGTRHA